MPLTGQDKADYQRNYMRKRRAAAKQAAPAMPSVGTAERERRRNAGLCVQCGAPATRNINLPAVNQRKARESGQTLERASTMATCQACRDIQAERRKAAKAKKGPKAIRAERRAKGLCVRCGQEDALPDSEVPKRLQGRGYGEHCLARARSVERERKQAWRASAKV